MFARKEKPADNERAAQQETGEASLLSHLVELRNRLLYCIYGVVVAMVVLAIFPGPSGLFDWLAAPIKASLPSGTKLVATGVLSPFLIPLKVLMLSAVLLAMPWLIYQVWAFVAPGLYKHEKRFALPLIVMGSSLAYVGIAFVQFFVLDKILFFIAQASPKSVTAMPDIGSYIEMLLNLYIAFAAAFQVPVVVVLLVKLGVMSVAQLKQFRGYFIIAAFVIAAVITPPDVISQLALALPMCLLYEVGIWACTWWFKPKASEEEATSPASSPEPKQASQGAGHP